MAWLPEPAYSPLVRKLSRSLLKALNSALGSKIAINALGFAGTSCCSLLSLLQTAQTGHKPMPLDMPESAGLAGQRISALGCSAAIDASRRARTSCCSLHGLQQVLLVRLHCMRMRPVRAHLCAGLQRCRQCVQVCTHELLQPVRSAAGAPDAAATGPPRKLRPWQPTWYRSLPRLPHLPPLPLLRTRCLQAQQQLRLHA